MNLGLHRVLMRPWHKPSRCRPRERGDPVDTKLPVHLGIAETLLSWSTGSPRSRGRQRRVIASRFRMRESAGTNGHQIILLLGRADLGVADDPSIFRHLGIDVAF